MAPLNPKERALLLTHAGLSEGAISGILGIDLDDVNALMTENEPQVTFPVVERRTLNHQEILSLGTDPTITIVEDPGPGKGVIPLWCVLVFASKGGYNNSGTLEIDADLAILADGSDVLGQSDFRLVTYSLNQVVDVNRLKAFENQDLPLGGIYFDLRGGSGISGGHPDNTLTAIVGYLIAEIPA